MQADHFQVTSSLEQFAVDAGLRVTLTNVGSATIYGSSAMFASTASASWSLLAGASRTLSSGPVWVRTDPLLSSALTIVPIASGVAADTATNSPVGGVAPLPVSSIEGYGHSWPAGFGTTNAKYSFISRLGKMLGNVTTNIVPLAGGMVASPAAQGGVGMLLQSALVATDLTAGPYVTPGGLKMICVGFNDWTSLTNGTVAGSNALVENALTLAYSRLLAARVVNALSAGPVLNAGGLTYSGSWTAFADTTVSSGLGYAYVTTNGNYVELVLDAAYNGEAITAILPIAGSNTHCLATVTVGGVTKATFDTNSAQAALLTTGTGLATCCVRVPAGVLPAGAQTVRVTFSNVVGFACFGGFIIEGTAPLAVIGVPDRPGVPASTPTGITAGCRWQNARNAAVAAAFPSAFLVDTNPGMCPNYATATEMADDRLWFDSAHANNVGHGRVAAEAIKTLRYALTAEGVGQMS